MTELAAAAVAAALLLGYLLGWHRGALGLPLWRQRARRPQRGAESPPPRGGPSREDERMVESQRKLVQDDLEKLYPHLTKPELANAVEEVLTRGLQLRVSARRPPA